MASIQPSQTSSGGIQSQSQSQGHRRPRPLASRKLDIVYLVFFIIHVPVMLLIDLAPLQPTWLRPRISYTLREYYLERYQDRYFEHPPAWFTAYMYLEAGYHSPLSLWMIWNIPRDHILVPLHLLLFALETAITTLTCVVDVAAWEGYTAIQRKDLYGLYVPYLVIGKSNERKTSSALLKLTNSFFLCLYQRVSWGSMPFSALKDRSPSCSRLTRMRGQVLVYLGPDLLLRPKKTANNRRGREREMSQRRQKKKSGVSLRWVHSLHCRNRDCLR
ncbi:hypothetical protein HRR80_001514 [Exophiala dermatitidis]|uniref:EXPERA domain-containing protein n=1 Tax=Exophiala dermatitidis TaxID=5970 RepID=A0AAN6IXE5_EXODE|nr:hypothetical protein HRR76_007440 [Exophiala dermatitidis]KAJ4547045.1 hypothetical protein HRR77_004579 [Exophiala dermatitidis]KAJ4573597.1 hypothetical protein HRR79_002611 [Exophiala dermatitidis]KAJ4584156.1 hypothetical protein HRR82_003483 [Exophiala dermatitidis]KAJ4623537.1 hypothetical protein HRR85_000401 [Exophiala dermatitidis]